MCNTSMILDRCGSEITLNGAENDAEMRKPVPFYDPMEPISEWSADYKKTGCGRHCLTCAILDKFSPQIEVKGITLNTVSNIDCNSRSLVYLLLKPCGRCYIGTTQIKLKEAIRRYRRSDREDNCICDWNARKLYVIAQGTGLTHIRKKFIAMLDRIGHGLDLSKLSDCFKTKPNN